MIPRIKLLVPILLIAGCTVDHLYSQILDDSTSVTLISKGIDHIYNRDFDKARESFNNISDPYTGHPVTYLIKGLTIYWENYPLLPGTDAMTEFENNMRKCSELSEREPYAVEFEAEALLANISSRGLLLVFYTDNHMSKEVIPLATSTYKYIMKAFDFNRKYPDLYYFTGIYNYYRDAYPKHQPVYKPVAVLFPPGNLDTGLYQLNLCAANSILLRAEASSILSWIYTNYENDALSGVRYTGQLSAKYPRNLFFKALHLKNLLLLGRYDEAENLLILSDEESGNKYYSAQTRVFNGIIQEKKYKNQDAAFSLYNEALKELQPYGDYGNEYSAYALFGLSRISDSRGNKSDKRNYHRRALNLASFKKMNFD